MDTTPIDVSVRYGYAAFLARARGASASSTNSPIFAIERLAAEILGAQKFRVEEVTPCTAVQPGLWRIHPEPPA